MEERVRLSARPEAPWALWSGIAGGVAAAVLSVKGIFESGSSTAAIGLVLVPFLAIAAMVFAGIWGLALGCVAASLRRAQHYAPALLLSAWIFALAVPAAAGWEAWRGLALQDAVRAVPGMTSGELDDAFAHSRWNSDRFFLGALALNPAAGPALLDGIAALPDAELYESMGSLWDVMGKNSKGIAVMRLVAGHAHAQSDTLARFADGPHADRVRHELAKNPNTPLGVLQRWFDSSDYLVQWGLALNPNTPPGVMEKLAHSSDRYARLNLTYNPATPDAILEQLTRDSDEILARNARLALKRRGIAGSAPTPGK
jgi:hypothetical protein